MTEAEARVGKRARILDSRLEVPPGTTGTVISAMRAFADGQRRSASSEGKIPEPTEMWVNNLECDDPLTTVIQIYEWDGSLEEL